MTTSFTEGKSAFEKIEEEFRLSKTAFPMSVKQCGYDPNTQMINYDKGCGFFDISDPIVIKMMEERGLPLWEAGCRCISYDTEKDHRAKTRLTWSNIPNPNSPRYFSDFEHIPGTKEAFDACREFAHGEGAHVLVLAGGVGSGKSHLMESTARNMFNNGKSVRYILAPVLMDDFRSAEGKGTKDDLMDRYDITHNLLLDDLGMERRTEYVVEEFTKLIEKRIQYGGINSRLLIATNLDEKSMEERYGSRIADRLWSRSDTDVRTVIVSAESYRQKVAS